MKYVMVIDDSVTIRSSVELVIKDMISYMGYAVKQAENGSDAINKIAEISGTGDEIGLCIVDVNMPVMDGLQFVKEFRKSEKFTPILMLTTEAGSALIEEAKKAGASGWIVKPFKVEQLTDTVKQLLN
jgi:two-component system, chemotaxis family, chemotaxis protein CheY